jgi:CRP-like cAMP-binding protein
MRRAMNNQDLNVPAITSGGVMGFSFMQPNTPLNDLLSQISVETFSDLRPHLTRVSLVRGQVLSEPGHEIEHMFFIEDGMVSMVADPTARRAAMQVAMIGREGVVGGMALLAPEAISTVTAICQIPGPAIRVAAPILRAITEQCPPFRDLCLGFVHSLMVQTMQTAASNVQHTLEERCVRWLLMADDRMQSSDLLITHEGLATTLGVRRASVTVVLACLEDAGLIRAKRGRITIVDRAALELLNAAEPEGGACSDKIRQAASYYASTKEVTFARYLDS